MVRRLNLFFFTSSITCIFEIYVWPYYLLGTGRSIWRSSRRAYPAASSCSLRWREREPWEGHVKGASRAYAINKFELAPRMCDEYMKARLHHVLLSPFSFGSLLGSSYFLLLLLLLIAERVFNRIVLCAVEQMYISTTNKLINREKKDKIIDKNISNQHNMKTCPSHHSAKGPLLPSWTSSSSSSSSKLSRTYAGVAPYASASCVAPG